MMLYFLVLAMLVGSVESKEDPEEHMSTPEMIRYMGYEAEEHWVTTSDGYILGIHRITGKQSTTPGPGTPSRPGTRPGSPSRPVVFLQHGLVDSSATWVMNYPNNSLGFMLSDAGYDVWLGNIRGNTYSTNHTTLSPKDAKFWEFTFDEFAAVDLPAMIDYVLTETDVDTVSYVGHSQGTLMAFIGFSQNKTLAARINFYGALAPVARITYLKGLVKAMNIFEPELEVFFKIFGIHDFIPSNWIMKALAALVCPLDKAVVCRDVIFLLAGYDLSDLDEGRVPIYISHTPAGTSVRNMIHWAQLLRDKRLQKYDYGSVKENIAHYNSTTPPQYDIRGLAVPTALIAGGRDFLADPRDVAWLEGQLDPRVIVRNIFYDDYNHLDFVWGMDAYERVYKYVIELIGNFNRI